MYPKSLEEGFEVLLSRYGVSFEEIKQESKELGIPVIEVIAKVRKIADYDQIAKTWSEIYNIPYIERDRILKNHEWYVEIVEEEKESGIKVAYAIWHPKYYPELLNRGVNVYIAPYTLFKIKDVVESGIVGSFMEMVKSAQKVGATDIHFEVKDYGIDVKFRLLGDLRNYKRIGLGDGLRLIKAIKTLASKWTANLDTEEWRERQDARIVIPEIGLDLRLAFTPSLKDGYQNLVIRLLSKSSLRVKGLEDLIKLGYLEEDANVLYSITKYENGVNIIGGATGSGKSRTINTLLALVDPKRKILTVEDPVEYVLENAVQHQVMRVEKENGKVINMDYLEYLRAFMRQDPDVILIGEWRKIPELTEALLYASETGHLVFTTLHSSRVVNTPNLLVNQYGLQKEDISNNVNILINQKLVKRVCQKCKRERVLTEDDIRKVSGIKYRDRDKFKQLIGKKVAVANPEGCSNCRVIDPMTGRFLSGGYEGRTVLYEYLVFDEDVMKTLLSTTSVLDIEKLLIEKVKEGKAKTFVDVAVSKVESGIVEFEEILRRL